MKQIKFSSAAEARLDRIYAYTFELHGERQADRYYHLLMDGIDKLATDDILEHRPFSLDTDAAGTYDFLSRRIANHRVIYRITDDALQILTIIFPGEPWEAALASITSSDLEE